MAVIALNGVNLAYNQGTFDQLAQDSGAKFGNKVFKSALEPLRAILTRAAPPVQRQEIIFALNAIQMAKRIKYAKAIDYLIFYWPNLILPGDIIPTAVPGAVYGTTFAQEFALMLPNEFVDLVYGATAGRGLAPYTGLNARICDDFNNAADIGTGLAFGRQWQGTGFLDDTANTATTTITNTTNVIGLREGINQNTRHLHVTGLMATRNNPSSVFAMANSKLKKDAHLTRAQIQAANFLPANDRRIEKHFTAHCRLIKGVRKACKGGIAMVASSMAYRAVNAKIHFILDGLGDLGSLAMKLPLYGDYVAITTSELAFCYRYWNDPVFPLSNIVKFYVNGNRVIAPWEGNWNVNDYNGNPIISNQEAWLRYGLARSIRGIPKPFPSF